MVLPQLRHNGTKLIAGGACPNAVQQQQRLAGSHDLVKQAMAAPEVMPFLSRQQALQRLSLGRDPSVENG
jgi:hypothetical protein